LLLFALAASCLLPERIGPAKTEALLLSGRSMGADEGLTAFVERRQAKWENY